MKKKIALALCAAATVTAAVALHTVACASKKEVKARETTSEIVESASIYVKGYEWGPGVPKVILKLTREAAEVTAEDLEVITAKKKRQVTGYYLSDERGNAVDGSSCYLTIELATDNKSSGNPFRYDIKCFQNKWMDTYPVAVTSKDFALDGEAAPLLIKKDCIESRICPDTEAFTKRGSHTGTYRNGLTGQEDEITLRTAAYEPESLAGGEKNPLIIWLHGQGEGGTDVDIELLGNEVVALAQEKIQSHFSAGEQQGAYVLAVQCETYWMDEGDGKNGEGSGVSRYTEALMDTIQEYVDSNPDVDRNRIYLGGCSNGGYMTMNMLINYPDYFAAAYPVCEAYSFYNYTRGKNGSYGKRTSERWFTEETAEKLRDLPIWFILSGDDSVVKPEYYELPTYQALLKAGAENTWLSVFENVTGIDDPSTKYMGHFSWIYVFKDQVTGVQRRESIAAAKAGDQTYGTVPTNAGGGAEKAGAYDNLFDWLNAQSR